MWLSLGEPAVLFIVCFFARHCYARPGPSLSHSKDVGLTHGLRLSSHATVFATIAAIVCYVLQVLFGRRLSSLIPDSKVDICDSCHRVKRRDGKSTCECGGTFEDFDKWTWADEDG